VAGDSPGKDLFSKAAACHERGRCLVDGRCCYSHRTFLEADEPVECFVEGRGAIGMAVTIAENRANDNGTQLVAEGDGSRCRDEDLVSEGPPLRARRPLQRRFVSQQSAADVTEAETKVPQR
jgi:hypothetical protein